VRRARVQQNGRPADQTDEEKAMLMNWHLYSTVPEYECDHVFTFLGGWRCVECGELFNPTITIIPIRDVLRAMAKITSSGDGQALVEREEGKR